MNINELNRIKFFNIEAELRKDMEPGTFKEILDMVYNDTIIPLVNNEGTILGISVNSGCDDILKDNIAQIVFEQRYAMHPVMLWVMKALECKATGMIIKEVLENNETGEVAVVLNDGVTKLLIEGCDRQCMYDEDGDSELGAPTSNIRIDYEDLDPDIDVDVAIARYLRSTYQRYLSRDARPQFTYEYDEYDDTYIVNDVKWGRRI